METEEIEKYFVDKKEQTELSWEPTITGFIECIQNELPDMFDKLSNTGVFPRKRDNELCSFYMRIVDNHIEIGIANIEFIR